MGSRRSALARRLVSGAAGVLGDRAPWLADRAYRVVAAPLQWADPEGGARLAEARLDGVRDRAARLGTLGARARRAEQQRIQRDLDRTREDLERIGPRLPAVQARVLALRLEAYRGLLLAAPDSRPSRGVAGAAGTPSAPAGTSGTPATSGTPRSSRTSGTPGAGGLAGTGRALGVRARQTIVVAGAGAGASAGLLLPGAGAVAVEAGLAAGLAAAAGVAGVAAARGRRARRERTAALAEALAAADAAVQGGAGADPRVLDRDRHALTRRVLASGRLDARGVAALRSINARLDVLLVRLVENDLEADASYLVQATVTRYLPDTLEPLLALPDPRASVGGRPAAVEVADQLTSIDGGLAAVADRPSRHQPESALLQQGDFLRGKFGGGPDAL